MSPEGPADDPAPPARLQDLQATFLAHRPTLERFLAARRHGYGDADDIMQELWIKISAQDVRPLAEPLSYIFRMAENLVLDRSRSASARRAREAEWTKGQIDACYGEAIDSAPSPEQMLIARDHLRRVEAVLDGLPETIATAFRAVRFDGRPQRQVAAEMGLSLSSVEKYLVIAFRAVLAVHPDPNMVRRDPPRSVRKGGSDARS